MANISFKTIASLMLLFCIGTLQAQPGGGGGLVIRAIFDANGNEISDDPNLRYRVFALEDSSANPTITEELYLEKKSRFMPHIILEPKRSTLHSPHLRLILMYKSDTMIVDFFGIIQGHGAGLRDRLDSLNFRSGYFHFPRNYRRVVSEADRNQAITYKGPVDLAFLLEKNLPISFHLREARQLLRNDQPLSALMNVQKAIAKNKKRRHGGILELQYEIYKKLKEYDKSLNAINELIALQKPVKNDHYAKEYLKDDYLKRIDLYYLTNQPNRIIDDYKKVIKISTFRGERAYYTTAIAEVKIEKKGNLKSGIKDLKSVIDTLSIENTGYRLSYSNCPDGYFLLGLAEYKRNNLTLAFKYWCTDAEFGESNKSNHFDSLILKHHGIPELHLARAMDIYYDRKNDTTDIQNMLFEKSLHDLQLAEKFGLSDFRINLFRAGILDKQKKYDDALAEINIAVSKNPNDPRVYYLRSLIRKNQNAGRWIPNDPDMIKVYDLQKAWIFQRYEF